MRDRVLDTLANEDVLLELDAADLVLSLPDPLAFVRAVLASMEHPPLVLTVDDFREYLAHCQAEEGTEMLRQYLEDHPGTTLEDLRTQARGEIMECLADRGAPVSPEVASFLVDLPDPYAYINAVLKDFFQRGLKVPLALKPEHFVIITDRRWWGL